MAFREWFRPPRHVLTIFLSVAVVSAVSLGWLTWLLVQQDRALDVQRRQARLEHVRWPSCRVRWPISSCSSRRMRPARRSPLGVVIVITGPTGVVEVVRPDGGLLYYQEPEQVPESPTAFVDAEHAEFARRDLVAAGNLYTALASGTDTAVRAGALADAVQWLWEERPWEDGGSPDPTSRRLVQIEGTPVLAVWNASPESLRVGVAGPSYLAALGHEAIPDSDLDWTLSDPAGRVVLGEPSPSPLAVRTAAASRLPFSLQVYSAAGPDLSPTSPRQGLLLWVLALLAVVWVTGAYFIVRAISRELAVERLQSDFVAGVSHEFRSPLSALSQIAEMLVSDRLVTDDLRRQSYDVLARETDRLRRLVEGLLDFGRFAAGGAVYHFEPLEIGSFLETLVADFAARAAATGHTIELSLPAVTTYVRGDRDALSRAIWNLLDNAVKYSPDCHTVWLDVQQDQNRVSLTVRDHGLGIPADEQRAIFERFVRGADATARRIKGTGVGLAMVQRIAEAHGGEIRLTSQPGQGSRFTMILRTSDGHDAAGGVT